MPKAKAKSKNKGGRPPDPTVEELNAAIEAYFESREAEGRFPTESGMLI